jgi:hypothetical protein
MKITNRNLQSKVQILSTISNKQLPVKISYAIAKNINIINTELKTFEGEKIKILEQYASKNEDGTLKIEDDKYVFAPGNGAECQMKYNELLDIEVDLELRTIKVDDLLNSNINFTPAELIELDFMIIE